MICQRIFLNETTGNVLRLGDTLKMHALAKTLKDIAEHGVDIFYKGSVGIKVVEDTQRRGGILTKDDLLHYRFEILIWFINSDGRLLYDLLQRLK